MLKHTAGALHRVLSPFVSLLLSFPFSLFPVLQSADGLRSAKLWILRTHSSRASALCLPYGSPEAASSLVLPSGSLAGGFRSAKPWILRTHGSRASALCRLYGVTETASSLVPPSGCLAGGFRSAKPWILRPHGSRASALCRLYGVTETASSLVPPYRRRTADCLPEHYTQNWGLLQYVLGS